VQTNKLGKRRVFKSMRLLEKATSGIMCENSIHLSIFSEEINVLFSLASTVEVGLLNYIEHGLMDRE